MIRHFSGRSPCFCFKLGHSLASHREFSSTSVLGKQRLVILGSGWAGYEILRGIDKKRWSVTIISPTTYFNFTPLLSGCATGTLELRCAVEPVRRYTPAVNAYQAWCDRIDFKRKVIDCSPATPPVSFDSTYSDETTVTDGPQHLFPVYFDKLVIAVGAYSQTFNIPGVKQYAFFLKDVRDARAIRTRILECFEQANQPTISDVDRRKLLNFCIVGGGPTGVEFGAELHDLIHAEIEQHYPSLARMAKITLFDVAPTILGTFDSSLIKYTEKTFAREGISILTRHHVERVEKGKLFVKELGEVPFGVLVWSTGLAPNPLINSITSLKKDKKSGRSLLTNNHLNVIDLEGAPLSDVWALGDASTYPGEPLPATAQVANQQAKYLTKKLNCIAKEKESSSPFEFHNQGSLAYIGNWKAIYDRSGSSESIVPDKETGRTAFILWRSAYFTRTLSIRNKYIQFPIEELRFSSHYLESLCLYIGSLTGYLVVT